MPCMDVIIPLQELHILKFNVSTINNHSNGLWEGGGWSSKNITTETLGPPLVWLNTKPGYGWSRTFK